MYDCIIIGKGPAGISCAIYLKRFNKNVLVIGKDYGSLGRAKVIENYYGFNSISGLDLAKKGEEQAKNLGIEVITDEVLEIMGLTVMTKNNSYEAKSIFLATGKTNKANISGIDDSLVSYCATCDGFFFRGKKIALIGYGDFMMHEYDVLKNFTKDITIFSNSEENIKDLINGKIKKVFSKDEKKCILVNDTEYLFDGIFVASSNDSMAIAKHLGLITDSNNKFEVDNFKTNIDGIFAGGDAIDGLDQVSTSVSDGAKAAIEINKYLKEE
ncbi:MAG: NAD(P)/FAD-dependent oxidoreductase [bacterium]|nr:NAD(P)/FAD-dependent oxidoreductase [bacterium]